MKKYNRLMIRPRLIFNTPFAVWAIYLRKTHNMVRLLLAALSLLCFPLHAMAIDATVAHATFFANDPTHGNRFTPSLDIYWQVNPRTLHYVTTPDKTITAHIKADLVFTGDMGLIKEDHFLSSTPPRNNPADLVQNSVFILRHYALPYGNIKIKLTLTDLADSTHPFVYADSISTSRSDKPFYGSLQLLDTIISSSANTSFSKNNSQQIPLCLNFLDDNKHQLHFYTELYHTNSLSQGDYPIIQKTYISHKEGESPLTKYVRTDTITSSDKQPISGSFLINALESGNYYLNTTLQNSARLTIASASTFFQRMNKNPEQPDSVTKTVAANDTGLEHVTVLNLDKTFLHRYDLAQLKAILKMLLPVSDPVGTQAIQGFIRKPDEMYMRYYIYNYFAGINRKDPGEAWKEFSSKVKEVNKRFSESGIPGYETERGFIYLRYGQPTEIINVENEVGALPYEVWQYNVLTQLNHKDVADAVFLFYKRSEAMSVYRLLHSSVTGEMQNPAWRNYLYVNDQGGQNGNSRAEQYIGNK